MRKTKSRKPYNLVTIRNELGLTQREVAEFLEVTEQTIRNWEQGNTIPRLSIFQVKLLCELLEMPIEDIPDNFGPPPERSRRK